MTDLKHPSEEESAFHKVDTLDGQWLSPVKTEREWQKQKLLEIFGHEDAGPRWQYMNGLIDMSLKYIELTKDEDADIIDEVLKSHGVPEKHLGKKD